MHRCSTGILILLMMAALAVLTGCLGQSTKNPNAQGVKTVSLNPAGTQSIDVGATETFSASATDALGRAVPGVSIQFVVTSGDSNPAPITINANGAGCAGTWDSTQTICSPGSSGIAIVTATAEGVSSPQTTIYVHPHISRIEVSRIDIPTPPPYDCFSQGQPHTSMTPGTWDYQAIAYDINNVDITNAVGPVSWAAENPSVVTINNVTGLLKNQVQVTAKTPGITQLFASVSGVTSNPMAAPFTTCLVSYIRLQAQGVTGNSFTLNSGAKVIEAVVVDTLGVQLANPPLTWSSSNPEAASFSSATNTTGNNSISARANAGGSAITASCTPPTCNIGVSGLSVQGAAGVLPGLPVYASNGKLPIAGQPVGPEAFGVISLDVTPTKIPTYSAWAATTQCNGQLNCQSITFSVTPGSNPVGTSAVMSRTPNSMVFNQQGTRIYFGSDQGLMYLDVGAAAPSVTEVSTTSTPCNVSLCGKVLAISPDGNRVVISDSTTNPHQVYVFNGGTSGASPIDVVLSDPTEKATAAAFSPDEMKIFILTDKAKMYVYSAVDGLTSASLAASATDVAFSADGSIAYVAGDPAASITGYSTCSLPGVPSQNLGSGPTAASPMRIFTAPGVQANGPTSLVSNGGPNQGEPASVQNIIALEPPILEVLSTQFTQQPGLIPPPQGPNPQQFLCNPPVVSAPVVPFVTSSVKVNLGQGTFAPLYMRVVGNGTAAVVVAKLVPAVLFVDLNQQTTTPVPLVNNGLPLAASASTDGSQVYVAACDVYTHNDPNQCSSGSVHIINRDSGGDVQQVPYVNFNTNNSMCTVATAPPCFPDMIAIKAQ